jgi:hypothetical protein
VVREHLRRRGVALTLTPDGFLKAAPRTALTDADRAAIRALRDELAAVVRESDERPARILALAAALGWPAVHPFAGQSVGPGEADERRVLDRRTWSQQPNGAEHRELFFGALAGVLTHRLERVTSHAGRAVDEQSAGRRYGHLRLLPPSKAHGAAVRACAARRRLRRRRAPRGPARRR